MKPIIMKRILAAMLACASLMPANAQILRTKVAQGEIEGELYQGYALYRAIPYAEPPVGNLRWKAPVPKAPWQGVYKAEKWGDRPWQPGPQNPNGGNAMSEDCLYLSVETPAKSTDERLPVFVNIHGGGFSTGSYMGTQENFCAEGIVYVSIEYRLGPLGFMAHPELSKESKDGISGNYGIYDQICALRWIHDNIAAFGGDPEKVTICGESAGGISVSILCASPLCKGLFRAAISESGGSFNPPCEAQGMATSTTPYKIAEKTGLDYQKVLDVKNLKQLRKVDAAKLIEYGSKNPQLRFWPVVDGIAITGDQYKLYEQGTYNDVDVMVGYNSDEGSLFVRQMTLDDYRNMVRKNYGDWADKCFEAYPASNDQEALYAVQDIFRDSAFGWGSWTWCNLQSTTGKKNVYMYYFDQVSENSMMKNTRGATHVAEMPFIYGWSWMGKMNDVDTHISQIMFRYWVNFIKNGNPNADALPYWPNYNRDKDTVMKVHNGFYLIGTPNKPQMDFFDAYFRSQRR